MNGRRVASFYLDVGISKYQYRLLNPTPLEFITGYIVDDSVGDRALKILPRQRLNLIDDCISGYCCILNYPEWLHTINKANKLASVLVDIESARLG